MRKCVAIVFLLAVCTLVLSACGCEHQWQDADCLNPKTCTLCGETVGESAEHTAGSIREEINPVSCTVTHTQNCTVCDAVTDTSTTLLESLVVEELFLCSPTEFMDRLVQIAAENDCTFAYEMGSNQGMLKADLTYGKYQALIQFFQADASTLADNDTDSKEVWCISLIHMGECPAEVRLFFWMAADPLLDADSAAKLYADLAQELVNAALEGSALGYLTQNGLLHEVSCIPAGSLGLQEDMSMFNIYASDFR